MRAGNQSSRERALDVSIPSEAKQLNRVAPAEAVVERARGKAESLTRLDLASHETTKRRVRGEALERLREGLEADVEDWRSRF